MLKRNQVLVSLTVVSGLLFLFMACGGGGGGGGDVSYEGSTDPAVADSTNATILAEYGLGMVEAGFPLGGAFVTPPAMGPVSLSAQPLAATFTTTVTMDIPPDAGYYGSYYNEVYGTGTARIEGSMTMLVGNDIAADADTWFVIEVEFDGSITFDDFRTDDGPDISGTVTIPYGLFTFSGIAEYSMSQGEFLDDPGLPIWEEVELTFSKITVSDDGETWYLGEGEWILSIEPGSSASLDIISMTVKYAGKTYKLETTRVIVTFSETIPLAAAEPEIIIIEETDIVITGIDYKAGTLYHPDLGYMEFGGNLHEEDPPGDIISGYLVFHQSPSTVAFNIYFGYDGSINMYAPATFYNLYMNTEEYAERGYFIDGEFIPSDLAPIIVL
jgi:hypothetical protein